MQFCLANGVAESQRCINSTHLETIIEWTEDGTDKNMTQLTNCTMPVDSDNRCDTSVNQCKHIRRSETGDMVTFVGVTFTTGMFFFLGLKVQPAKEFSLLKNGMQILFFLVGFWMLILNIGITEAIAVSSGVSENTLNLVQQTVTTLSRVIYVVMFLLFLSYLISALWLMMPSKRK